MLCAALRHAGETGADFHPLDRVDAHQCVGQFGIQAIEDRLTQPWHHALGDHGDLRPDRVLVAAQLIHIGLKLRHLVRVRAEKGVVFHTLPALERNIDRPQLAHVAAHADAETGQDLLGNCPGRYAHGGFPRRTAAATAVIAQAIFMVVGVVSMGRAEQVLDR